MMEGPPQQPEEEKIENQEQGPQSVPEKEEDPYAGLTPEQIEMYESYIADHPEIEMPPESREDHTERAAALGEEMTNFEGQFDLEALNAITDLTPEEAPSHPVREPARQALESIVRNLNYLQEKTDIPPEVYDELDKQYKHLSQAVGIINNNKVDHTR